MIDLEMPYGRGSAKNGDIALKRALTYGRTSSMSRWHIPRDGVLRDDTQRIYSTWCSATMLRPDDGSALMVDEITDGVPVCGPCVGKATGAGHQLSVVAVQHEGGLIFEPRHMRRPKTCPGSQYRDWHHVNFRVGRCWVCGEYMPLRARGGPYNSDVFLVAHEPGIGLVDPCPFHAWDSITAEGVCSCGSASVPVVAS